MLVVTLIVALLAGMVLGLAGYVQGRQARSQVRAQMAMIEAACEGFRADTGHYPTSTPARVTLYWKYGSHWFPIQIAEVENAGLLFQQLMGGGYIDASSFRVKSEPAASTWVKTCNISSNGGWVATSRTEAIIDPWGKFYNYYCVYPRPATVGTTETVSGSCVYLCQANISGVVVWVTCNVSYTHLRSNGPQVNLTFDLWSSGPDGLNNQGGGDDIANFVR